MKLHAALLAVAALLMSGPAHAQAPASPATNALSACLVRSTTPADHTLLAQWMFLTMSRHPSVMSMSAISNQQTVAINRQMGTLVNRLLLDACAAETRAAVAAHGPNALQGSFEVLGRTAAMTLMGHPDVEAGLGGFAAYLDRQRLETLLSAQ